MTSNKQKQHLLKRMSETSNKIPMNKHLFRAFPEYRLSQLCFNTFLSYANRKEWKWMS